MVLDFLKVLKSAFPFIKEVFLWRDGAEEGKPVTRENLIRRKIAVFALMGSLILNYVLVSKFVDIYKENKEVSKKYSELYLEFVRLERQGKTCLKPIDALHMVKDEIAFEMAKLPACQHKAQNKKDPQR